MPLPNIYGITAVKDPSENTTEQMMGRMHIGTQADTSRNSSYDKSYPAPRVSSRVASPSPQRRRPRPLTPTPPTYGSPDLTMPLRPQNGLRIDLAAPECMMCEDKPRYATCFRCGRTPGGHKPRENIQPMTSVDETPEKRHFMMMDLGVTTTGPTGYDSIRQHQQEGKYDGAAGHPSGHPSPTSNRI